MKQALPKREVKFLLSRILRLLYVACDAV